MNGHPRWNAPNLPLTAPYSVHDIESCILATCDGLEGAAEIVDLRLRPRLLAEVLQVLGPAHAMDADDVVDHLLREMLNGMMGVSRGGGAVPRLLSVARWVAERHVEVTRRRWGLDD
jgi:hypothetical protein